MAEFDVVLITAPDRLARKYVHQVLLIEELQDRGCRVEFVERPMSQDPNDQLLLQRLRGAVAEYERTLIAERMCRGRLAGYRTNPEKPRDPAGLRIDEYEAAIVGADVRLVLAARSNFRQPRKKAHRKRRSHSYR